MNLFFLIFLFFPLIDCNILAIDIGSSIKIGLYDRTKRKYDIILNAESARKNPCCVGIKNTGVEAVYGGIAKESMSNRDTTVFCDFNILLGCSLDEDSSQVSFYKKLHPGSILEKTKDRKFGISFCMKDAIIPSFSVEELLALLFSHLKGFVQNTSDCIISIPPYFSPIARQAVLDAAELAGLNVLELIHDLTAAVFQYSLTVPFDLSSLVPRSELLETQVLFMDFGHSHTSASLFSYQRSGSPPIKGATKVSVLKTKSIFGIGGASIDMAIRDYFYDEFCKQDSRNKIDDPAELARILHILITEASIAKFKLTALPSINIHIDSLYQGRSFKTHFSRVELEGITKNLIPQFISPLVSILTDLGYSTNTTNNQHANFSTLMLIGGTSRVLFIQDALRNELVKFFGSNNSIKLGYSINADEGPVLGAALKALISDIKFNTNTVKLFERPTSDIFVIRNQNSAESEPLLLWGESSSVPRSNLNSNSILPTESFKKLLVYTNESFSLDLLVGSDPTKLWRTIEVVNVSEAINTLNLTPLNESRVRVGNPFVKVGFSYPLVGPTNGITKIFSCDMIQKINISQNNKSDPISIPLSFNVISHYPSISSHMKECILKRQQNFETFASLKGAYNSVRNTLESNIFSLRQKLQSWKEARYPPLKEFFEPHDFLHHSLEEELKELIDVVDDFYEKLDYGYEIEDASDKDISEIMRLQIELFLNDNTKLESYLLHGKLSLNEYLKQNEEKERILRAKLAEEARVREEEEARKRKEAAEKFMKELQEKMNQSLGTNETLDLNETLTSLPESIHLKSDQSSKDEDVKFPSSNGETNSTESIQVEHQPTGNLSFSTQEDEKRLSHEEL